LSLAVRVHDGGDEGPPVVLVHGSMDRGAAFARVAPLLGPRLVVRYDRRGYGRSHLDGQAPLDVAGHADDLLAVIDEHAGGRAVVVGHSIGGVFALVAAQRGPGAVAGVGAYEAPMSWAPWWPAGSAGGGALAEAGAGPGAVAEAFVRRMIGNERWDALGPALQAERRAEGPALLAELRAIRVAGEAPYDVDAVACPVLVARGTTSAAHHRRAADELARLVGPAAGPTVVEGAGHGAHRSHPEAFAAWAREVATRGS